MQRSTQDETAAFLFPWRNLDMGQIAGLGTPGCGSEYEEDLGRIKIVAYTFGSSAIRFNG